MSGIGIHVAMAHYNEQEIEDRAAQLTAAKWEQFGEYLQRLRQARLDHDNRWTQQYVADLTGLTRQSYSGIENGKPTKEKTIRKIALALEADPDDLLRKAGFGTAPKSQREMTPLLITIVANLRELPTDLQELAAAAIVAAADKYRAKRLAKKLEGADDPDSSYNHADAPLEPSPPRKENLPHVVESSVIKGVPNAS